MAHSSLVATTFENGICNCSPTCVTKAPRPTFTVIFSPKAAPLKKETDYANMSPFWRSIQDRGISEGAARLIMASSGNGTKEQYSIYITKLQKFCNQRQVNNIQPSLVPVLDFLTTPSRPHIHYHQHCQKCPVILH